MKRKVTWPTKTTMNLYYRVDPTTKPSTIVLYALFALVVLLAASKFLVFDLWMEKRDAEQSLTAAQNELNSAMTQLSDYNEVQERYFRYSATEEERDHIDPFEVLAMLESVGWNQGMNNISIGGDQIHTQLIDVTMPEVVDIVRRLEASPLVSGTEVSTAATNGADGDLVTASITIHLQKEAEAK